MAPRSRYRIVAPPQERDCRMALRAAEHMSQRRREIATILEARMTARRLLPGADNRTGGGRDTIVIEKRREDRRRAIVVEQDSGADETDERSFSRGHSRLHRVETGGVASESAGRCEIRIRVGSTEEHEAIAASPRLLR